MLKLTLLVLLFASPIFAQDSAAVLPSDGCGANKVEFDVKADNKQHPAAQPEPGKALVYVVGDAWNDHQPVHFPVFASIPVTRFGVDGTWVGANGFRSYFFFSVDPGEHRLCTNVQSKFESQVKAYTAGTSFTAEAGKIYYFRTKTAESYEIQLVPVDAADALALLANASFSTFHLKK
ncbi:MAG TPA: hypothetical protein VGD60_01070 [Candidatus Acidoferrales bacterium]